MSSLSGFAGEDVLSSRPARRQLTIKREGQPSSSRNNWTPPPTPDHAPAIPAYGPAPRVQLSAKQQEAYDLAMAGGNIFFTGPAGCGKSTLIRALIPGMQNQGKRVRILAPTGKAAILIGGSTIHSYLGLNQMTWNKPITFLENKARAPWMRQRMRDTDVLFIDEVSMVENELLERMDRMMRAGRGSWRPFGGVQLIFSGDFCQLGPVEPFKHCLVCGRFREIVDFKTWYQCKTHDFVDAVDRWAFRSSAWEESDLKHILLSEVHRQTDDDFKQILFKLWLGKQLKTAEQSLLTDHEFTGRNAVRLFSTRREVSEVNAAEFRRLPGTAVKYSAYDDFFHNKEHKWLEKKKERSSDGDHLMALLDHRYEAYLELKVGIPVVLLANLDVENGLVNDSTGKVVAFRRHSDAEMPKPSQHRDHNAYDIDDRNERVVSTSVPVAGGSHVILRYEQAKKFINRTADQSWPVVKFDNGRTVPIYANCDVQELGDDEPYSLLTRTQIPLHAAWAMTIHKAQGMTLPSVQVDISKTCEQGQVYVALSRAPTLAGLKVLGMRMGYACGSGHPEVHEWLWDKFEELRGALAEE